MERGPGTPGSRPAARRVRHAPWHGRPLGALEWLMGPLKISPGPRAFVVEEPRTRASLKAHFWTLLNTSTTATNKMLQPLPTIAQTELPCPDPVSRTFWDFLAYRRTQPADSNAATPLPRLSLRHRRDQL